MAGREEPGGDPVNDDANRKFQDWVLPHTEIRSQPPGQLSSFLASLFTFLLFFHYLFKFHFSSMSAFKIIGYGKIWAKTIAGLPNIISLSFPYFFALDQ